MRLNRFVMYSLKRGMLLSVSVPMLVAVITSAFLLVVELQQYSKARRAVEMKDLIGSMSALIHEQQKERGATSVYLSSGGEQFATELSAQRALTDQAAANLTSDIELHGHAGGLEIAEKLTSIARVLAERPNIRQSVDRLEIATSAALGHYTAHNATMLATIANIGSLAESPLVAQKVASLEALLAAKEFSGIERAIGSGGFAAGTFDFQRVRLLERLITRQNDNLARFETFAEESFRTEVEAIAELSETAEIMRMREVAFSSFGTGDLQNVTASDFFSATTARIDAFKDVEDRLVADIADAATEIARSSLNLVGLLVAGVLIAATASVASTIYVIRNMLKEVRRISDAGDRLAKGDETAELPKDSPKELGRIVSSIDFFNRSVSEAKEREAKELHEKQETERVAREEEQLRQQDEKKRAERKAIKARDEQERMKEYVAEVSGIVSACAKGDFSQKIDLGGKDGVFFEIGEGLNTLVQTVEEGLAAAGGALERVANGDLTTLLDGDFRGAFGDLQRDTNAMIGALRGLVVDIDGSTFNLSSSAKELRDTSDDLSKQAEQNAASLEETSAALEELSANLSQVNENVVEANKNARVARETAEESGAVAADAAQAMNRISDASKEIAGVVTAIDDISFQINLLALNAGVEAARAGEAGRGFSVVASEVRQLAQRAGEAATEIEAVIGRSNSAVSEGVAKVQNAQRSFQKISESVVGVSERIEHVSYAVSEQVAGIGEITNAVAQIDSNTQKQAASFEEVAATSNLLSSEADSLTQSTSRFDTGAAKAKATSTSRSRAAHISDGAPAVNKAPKLQGNLALDEAHEGWSEF